jgi:hypothetical protein
VEIEIPDDILILKVKLEDFPKTGKPTFYNHYATYSR